MEEVVEMKGLNKLNKVISNKGTNRETIKEFKNYEKSETKKFLICHHCKKEGHKKPDSPEIKRINNMDLDLDNNNT